MVRFRSSWVLPISGPPVRNGWVAVDRGRVIACGSAAPSKPPEEVVAEIDLGQAAIMPGLVNAHTHLELSYLRGQVPAGSVFTDWIRSVLAARRQYLNPNAPEILDGVDRGIAEALGCGTALVGDISNTLVTFAPLVGSPLAAVVFHELVGFNPSDSVGLVERAWKGIAALGPTDRVRASLAAHAPYSVSPDVFRAIWQTLDRESSATCSVHLAESAAEVEFIRTAGGPWRPLLEELGAWNPAWVAPGVGPTEYLDGRGFLDARLLAVHGVQMTPADLSRLVARGTTLVTCPRSNLHTGAGTPPIEAFYASGVRVAVGTDSLASTPDLNVFAELAELRTLARSVPASRLLDSATRQGARDRKSTRLNSSHSRASRMPSSA